MGKAISCTRWVYQIEEQIKALGAGVILVAAYSMYQGCMSVLSIVNLYARYDLSQEVAIIEMCFFLLSLFIIGGTVGLIRAKNWGVKTIERCYIVIIPMTFIAIYYSEFINLTFIVFKSLDMVIGFSILFFLSLKSTKKRFQ